MNGRPYHFGPRLRGAAAKALGLLHLTHNRGLGWPALLLRSPKGKDLAGACQVMVTAYPEYVVAEHRAGRAELVPGVLDSVAEAYEAALEEATAREHLESGRPVVVRPVMSITIREVRPTWPRWVPHAAAAASLLALVLPWSVQHTRAREPEPFAVPSPLAVDEMGTEGTMMLADVLRFSSTKGESMTVERRILMPKKPIDGQDTPPCTSPSKAENGGCWLELKDPPPCPKGAAEHKNACWVPVRGEKPMPMSMDGAVRGRR